MLKIHYIKANQAINHSEWGCRSPIGFIWHYNGKYLQLVPTDLHDAAKHDSCEASDLKKY